MDDQAFRNVMATSPAPVTVVTTMAGDWPVGCTVSAFMSLSLAPRLVAVALDRRTSVLAHVEAAQAFGVNLLSASQTDVALQFASSTPDRFEGISWWRDGGLPRLVGTSAWLGCRLAEAVDAGDHRLLMGEVLEVVDSTPPPMVYAGRLFGGHSRLQERPPAPLSQQLAALSR